MRLSANFFKKPDLSDIRLQYEKSNAGGKIGHCGGPVGGREESRKERQARNDEDLNKRSMVEKKVMDFSTKNKFKNKSSILKNASHEPRLSWHETRSEVGGNKEKEHRDISSQRKKIPQSLEESVKGENVSQANFDDKKEEMSLDCVICFNLKADMVCMPCGHSGICKPCSLKLCSKDTLCFLCKMPIDQLLQIDLSRTIGDMVIVLSSIILHSSGNLE